jgi:hypothetical protein
MHRAAEAELDVSLRELAEDAAMAKRTRTVGLRVLQLVNLAAS